MSKSKRKNQSSGTVEQTSTGVIVHGAPKPKCHTGNVVVMHQEESGGKLYCGGWTRGADSDGLAVIDLTGKEPIDVSNPFKALNSSAEKLFKKAIESAAGERTLPWLSFKIKDFGVPDVGIETWKALADVISKLMDEGHGILLACAGGHGRTGTAASIICYLLNKDIGDPVEYLRGVYCNDAVETYEQHKYVNEMLGLPVPKDIGYKHANYGASGWQAGAGSYGGYNSYGGYQTGYVWNTVSNKWEPPAPTTGGGSPSYSAKSYVYLTKQQVDDIVAYLNGYNIANEVVLYNNGYAIEVTIILNDDMTYYEIIGYDKANNSVKLDNVKTAETRTVGVEFLSTKEEVEKYYEKYAA